jgi:hypothetical protein
MLEREAREMKNECSRKRGLSWNDKLGLLAGKK